MILLIQERINRVISKALWKKGDIYMKSRLIVINKHRYNYTKHTENTKLVYNIYRLIPFF